MGWPIQSSGGAGVPIFHLVQRDLNISSGWSEQIATLPGGAEFQERSFIMLAGHSNRLAESPDSPSQDNNAVQYPKILKHNSTQIKIFGEWDQSAGDFVDIPVIEVPTRKNVYQHELQWQQVHNSGLNVHTVASTTTGFTPGDGSAKYIEGSPVIMQNYLHSMWARNNASEARYMQLMSFIKSDGSFDFMAEMQNNPPDLGT